MDTLFRPVNNCTGHERLPVFRQDRPMHSVFYTPGYVVRVPKDWVEAFENNLLSDQPAQWSEVTELRQRAQEARRAQQTLLTQPYQPVCLTLYLNNECNLSCGYCFAMPNTQSPQRLQVESVRRAAALVAANCAAQQLPFTAVFHGGGEPTLDREYADQLLDLLDDIVAAHGLDSFRYLATNGIMSEAKAAWAAQRFDLIGLSCDGPPAIQGKQRPLSNGKDSSHFVERTAHIIHSHGKPLHIRVTLTPETVVCQSEIADYLCTQFAPQEIHVELVYPLGRAKTDLHFPAAADIVDHLWRGRVVAATYGIPWRMSGSRPNEIHGPYCHVFRNVLNVIPGDVATACFTVSTLDSARARQVIIGDVHKATSWTMPSDRIRQLQQQLSRMPEPCKTCFNQYHCVRGCPEYCPLDNDTGENGTGSNAVPTLRCQVLQLLTLAYIDETLDTLSQTGKKILGGEIVA
jgi:radical SAM protein with 4Fe4S-binding SPASM domain